MATTLLTTGLLCVIAAIVGGGIEALGGKMPVIQSSKRQTILGLFGIILLLGAWFSSSSNVPPKIENVAPVTTGGPDSTRTQENMSSQPFHITLAVLSPDDRHRVTFAIDRMVGPEGPPAYRLTYMLEEKITDVFVQQLNLGVSLDDSNEALTVANNGLSVAQKDYLAGPVTTKALQIKKSSDIDDLKRSIAAVVLSVH